jgi:hypothetical protein
MVKKPKASMEGQCFIKLKASDKEKMKTFAPVEHDDNDADDGAVATIVEDSDDEEPSVPVIPAIPVKVEKVIEPVKVEEVLTVEPAKKKIIRKKTDA